eukprot:TRINITY_DN16023_c0_g1_i1.p1 TRINITY_DN16023_c0_g1~~TRINITY_DN16023_c0_g1_i1.p1  ORF type:complete len:131 (+),score=19.06 TRINITY_DN16023_c0_g1_i1:37-429(+)
MSRIKKEKYKREQFCYALTDDDKLRIFKAFVKSVPFDRDNGVVEAIVDVFIAKKKIENLINTCIKEEINISKKETLFRETNYPISIYSVYCKYRGQSYLHWILFDVIKAICNLKTILENPRKVEDKKSSF